MEENNVTAVPGDANADITDSSEVLSFSIDGTIYGIEVIYVKDIITIEQITVVPKIPDHIKGVINICT